MNLPQLGQLSIHQVLPGHVERVGEVVHLLELLQRLIHLLLYGSHLPEYSPGAIVDHTLLLYRTLLADNLLLVVLLFLEFAVAEAIVFESVSENLDITPMHHKVVAPIWWQIGPEAHWVFIWTEHQILLAHVPAQVGPLQGRDC